MRVRLIGFAAASACVLCVLSLVSPAQQNVPKPPSADSI